MQNQFAEQYQRLRMIVPDTTNPGIKAQAIYIAACVMLGIDPSDQPDNSKIREKYRASNTAHYKLCIIRDAITGEKEANWDDEDEDKFGGWFWMDSPGFRFCVTLCDFAYSYSAGGSRLCTFSDEDQEFFMKECVALWADFMGGKLPA